MKKLLLSIGFALMATIGGAQVIVYVEAPSANEGNYDHTYAVPGGWGVSDLTIPANSVQGNMVLADDGTANPNESCNALINGTAINGNIAVLYRGSCEFGLKAFNAQTAGAIGVIIINNLGGSPVGMGGGIDGPNVTIPVVMISDVDGALLMPEIMTGTSTVFIGSKNGLYIDDIGCTPADMLRAERFSNIQSLSTDGTEFDIQVGAWVRNYGQNDQNDVVLNCTIDLGGTNLYDNSSTPMTILSGDSAFISLPLFTQGSYANGYYDMEYNIIMGATDESTFDNFYENDFMLDDSLFAYSRMDQVTGQPIVETSQFHGSDLAEICVYFEDPNASRIATFGVNFAAGTSQNPTPTSLQDVFIQAYFYEWNDVFIDVNDYPDPASANLSILTQGDYIYLTDGQKENIFIAWDDQIALTDGQRYLVCLEYGTGIFPGYDTKIDYEWNLQTFLQPMNVVRTDGGNYFLAGFGTDRSPSVSLNFLDAATVNIAELSNETYVGFPNPASESIQVPIGNHEGDVQMTIIDITGKVVSVQEVALEGPMMTVDVTTLATGTYFMNLLFEDGTQGTIQVVVNR